MRWFRAVLTTWALACCATTFAAEWPTKPVHFIVPWPPGGLNDLIARAINEKVGIALGQTVVTEYKAGAGGRIGVSEIARAAPDGYVVGMGNLGPLTIAPTLYKKQMTYDVQRDLVPITMFAASPLVLVVPASSSYQTAGEFFADAKSKPGKYNFASVGLGSPQQLSFELINSRLGVSMVHVPYKGTTEYVPALVGNEVHGAIDTLPLLLPFIKAGRLRALAVTTAERVPQLPDVPTLKESKLFDEPILSWYALIAPKATPKAVVDRLYDAYTAAARSPEIQKLLQDQGLVYVPNTSAQFQDSIVKETGRWERIITDNNIVVSQ